eukprot:m.135611 g.135611  ORF g.135611 m.135611 type:complete len:78 (+) comp23919_c0_seq13:371-604(+)
MAVFVAALGVRLLFNFERPQFFDILRQKSTDRLADVYGAEHLLRLFVILEQELEYSSSSEHRLKPHVSSSQNNKNDP